MGSVDLYHEFTHHMESLAGEKMLEEKDEQQIRDYIKSRSDRGQG